MLPTKNQLLTTPVTNKVPTLSIPRLENRKYRRTGDFDRELVTLQAVA